MTGVPYPLLGSQFKKDKDLQERVQWRMTKESFRDLGLFSLEKTRLRGDLTTVDKYLEYRS